MMNIKMAKISQLSIAESKEQTEQRRGTRTES